MTEVRKPTRFITGFCNPSNPDEIHRSCPVEFYGHHCECDRTGCHNDQPSGE